SLSRVPRISPLFPYTTLFRSFAMWLDTPEPKAVLNGSIFFDMRPLHGDHKLVDDMRADVVARARHADLFLAYLARHAVARRPPRSEEHTSELQSRENLVCRLL